MFSINKCFNAFGHDGEATYRRLDAGVSAGINLEYSHFIFGAAYDYGLVNASKSSNVFSSVKTTNSNISISVGYKL